ncbi:MAG: molybdopterin-dependent oxidoreductase [Chloroflexi bacterium]|nr:molybdopterin-dependent oxidoreductase [Chloroflexota bacterium]
MKTDKRITMQDDAWVPTVCAMCYNACGVKAHRVNGVVVNVEGNPDCPQGGGTMCAKGKAAAMSLYRPGRLTTPLKRTNPEKGIGVDPKWAEISWDEALDIIADKLKTLREDDPRKLNIISFDTDVNRLGLMNAFAAAYGTPNTNQTMAAALFCGNSLHPVAMAMHGAIHLEPDLSQVKYLLLFGAQHGFMIGENAKLYSMHMAEARMTGTRVVVIDPICTAAGSKADEWLPIRPGTDAALALAMVNVLLNEAGIYDAEFIKKDTNGAYLIGADGRYVRDKASNKPLIWDPVDARAKTFNDPDIKDFALEGSFTVNGVAATPGFQLLKEHVKSYTCEKVAEITTLPAESIRRVAREFGEAARIGSTIVIDGKELPYRPACVYFRKGANQHKHSQLTGFAIELLNIIVGAIDVPGGCLGANSVFMANSKARWSWIPRPDKDGMLSPGMAMRHIPYYGREVKRPERLTMFELFPTATYSDSMMLLNVMDPDKFKFPYKAEILLHSYTNVMMSTINPEAMAAWLKKFSFQFSFVREINETAEFADVVLPDVDYLESLELVTPFIIETSGKGLGSWCMLLRQPVVEPPPGPRSRIEALLDIASRVGIRKDFYHNLNIINKFEEPYKLDINGEYAWEEILDLCVKSRFGGDHDLAWFKEHGFFAMPKKVEETYLRPFNESRVPLYLDYFLQAGEDVKRVTKEIGIPWDVSDYQALPDWKPCPPYHQKTPDHDLFAVNYKLPFHTWSSTPDNKWLDEIAQYHPYAYYILINGETARRKGIKDWDTVRLETEGGLNVEGVVKVTETVHPEVAGIAGTFGHWARHMPTAKGKGVHYNRLIPIELEGIDMLSSAVDCCIRVKVTRTGEASAK